MDIDLTGKRALVCGASSGIGRAAANELASMGAQVMLLARKSARLDIALVELLESYPSALHGKIEADLNEPASLGSTLQNLTANGPVHILVNNTGGPPGGPISQATAAGFLSAFHQHLLANHLIAQALIPGMRDAGYGRIINVISTSVKEPLRDLGVSNTIRGAVANWAKTLAMEVAADGITVNNVLPGFTRTARLQIIIESKILKSDKTQAQIIFEMFEEVPMRRFAEASEVAAAIAFLASPAASYITGINIPVDGGRTRSL